MDKNQTAPEIEPARHSINGEWVPSATVAKAVNPSIGELLGQYSAGGRIEAAAAISAARRAFDARAWSYDPPLRSRALLELADRLDERAEAIALMLSREMGKTLGDATLTLSKRGATSTVASDARGARAMEEFQEVKTQFRAVRALDGSSLHSGTMAP